MWGASRYNHFKNYITMIISVEDGLGLRLGLGLGLVVAS